MMRAASKSMRKDMSGLVIWLKMEARRLGMSSWALRAFWLLRWMKMYEAMARGNFLTIPYAAHVDNNSSTRSWLLVMLSLKSCAKLFWFV